jgi:hypothetical protein
MLPVFFRESLHAHTTIKGSLPYNEKNIFFKFKFYFQFCFKDSNEPIKVVCTWRLSLKKTSNIYLPFSWELILTSTIKFRANWIFDRLKIYLELFNIAVDLPKDKFNIIANIFHYQKVKFAEVKPALQQCETISITLGTYHNQGCVYFSTRHASGYIEKRIGSFIV